MLAFTRALVPAHMPMHALGVGHPVSIAACTHMGYTLFDSALPTRDARHGRLYAFAQASDDATSNHKLNGGKWHTFLYINDAKHIKDRRPVSENCDCLACTHYSRGYLHHLFKSNDATYLRLGTIHNLRFMSRLMERLRHE